MKTNEELAAFQAALLEHLSEEQDPVALRARLVADPATAPYAEYMHGWEDRCLEVAAELVQKWGRKHPPT